MTDFLTALATRSLVPTHGVQPRLPGRFEPAGAMQLEAPTPDWAIGPEPQTPERGFEAASVEAWATPPAFPPAEPPGAMSLPGRARGLGLLDAIDRDHREGHSSLSEASTVVREIHREGGARPSVPEAEEREARVRPPAAMRQPPSHAEVAATGSMVEAREELASSGELSRLGRQIANLARRAVQERETEPPRAGIRPLVGERPSLAPRTAPVGPALDVRAPAQADPAARRDRLELDEDPRPLQVPAAMEPPGPREVPVRVRPAAVVSALPVGHRHDRRRSDEEQTVHVTIGRVEVRASQPPPPPARVERPAPAILTLDEYLKQRSAGAAR